MRQVRVAIQLPVELDQLLRLLQLFTQRAVLAALRFRGRGFLVLQGAEQRVDHQRVQDILAALGFLVKVMLVVTGSQMPQLMG